MREGGQACSKLPLICLFARDVQWRTVNFRPVANHCASLAPASLLCIGSGSLVSWENYTHSTSSNLERWLDCPRCLNMFTYITQCPFLSLFKACCYRPRLYYSSITSFPNVKASWSGFASLPFSPPLPVSYRRGLALKNIPPERLNRLSASESAAECLTQQVNLGRIARPQ